MKRLPIFLMFGYLLASLCGFLAPWSTLVFGESVEDWMSKGKEAYQAANYEEAVNYYSKALEMDPKLDKALLSRGASHYKLKKWEDARSDYVKFTKTHSMAHEVFFQVGMTYFWQKDYANALPQFDKAIAIEKRPEYYLNAARVALNQGFSGTAIRYCKDAFALYPEKNTDEKFKEVMNKARGLIKAEIEKEKQAAREEAAQPQELTDAQMQAQEELARMLGKDELARKQARYGSECGPYCTNLCRNVQGPSYDWGDNWYKEGLQ